MNGSPAITPSPPGRLRKHGKTFLFTLIVVSVFFGGLELILALFGVRPLLSNEDPLVGFAGNVPLFVESQQADGGVMMKTAQNKLKLFNEQEFPLIKGKNSYRIFCMGGSTTHGRPYRDKTSFCGWLRQYLRAVAPQRHWEVINAGGVSYASYRVAKLMTELNRYQPDLYIVYTGQNEFLERRSYGKLIDMPEWLIDLNAVAGRSRIYTVMKDAIDTLEPNSEKRARERYQMNGEVDDILNHTAGPVTYHRDDRLKQQIVTHFRLNLGRMVEIAHEANAGIIFVTPAVNLKDMSPFKSEHRRGLSKRERHDWQDLFQRGTAQQAADKPEQALALYRQALAIDDRYAELHYRIGQVLYVLRRYDEAEGAFWRAVDEDIAPLRALYRMTKLVPEVAADKHVPVIDFPGILRAAYLRRYDNAIFGREFFFDHVHPTIEGYQLLGEALLSQLGKQGIAPAVDTAHDPRIAEVNQRVTASLDKADHARALAQLGKVLDWAGKFDEANNLYLQALQLQGPDPVLFSLLGKTAQKRNKPDESIRYFSQAVALKPDMAWEQLALANVLMAQDRKEEAVTHYLASLKSDPENPITHKQLGITLAELGHDEEALQHFNQALDIQPNFEEARYDLIVLLIRMERYDEALSQNRELLRIDSDNFFAHDSMGIILAKQGRFEESIAQFNEALRLSPNYLAAKKNLQEAEKLRKQAKAEP